ncbi:MAG: DNA polymerase III subunit gamma/tau, partial [Candidatus Omnitrophota bacterium]
SIAYARKYRPKNFDEIIDQQHIAVTLKNSILQNSFAHAYLFSGPRGTGKTSTARILAKALNCEKGPTVKPCNECSFCKQINEARSLDVLEIDGASNRRIDESRMLRENVKFATASSRFKIYIIDEVHMLTTEAFNALLKTLEEPPEHVKFIFATTEPHKVLPTILSRCQRFDFHKISAKSIVLKLKELACAEEIDCQEQALYFIAKIADGSLRDAEVILGQMNSFGNAKITVEDVINVFGLVAQEVIFSIVDNLIQGSVARNLQLIDQLIVEQSRDPVQIVDSLVQHFRNLMLSKCGCEKMLELAPEDREKLCEQSKEFSLENILYLIAVLTGTQGKIKQHGMGRLFLEMALIKLSEQDKLISLAELAKKLNHLKTVSANLLFEPEKIKARNSINNCSIDLEKSDSCSQNYADVPRQQSSQICEETDCSQDTKKESSGVQNNILSLKKVRKFWPEVIDEVKKSKPSLGFCLAEGSIFSLSGSNIVNIAFLKEHEFHRENLAQNQNVEIIENIVKQVIGSTIKINFVSSAESLEKDIIKDRKITKLIKPVESKNRESFKGDDVIQAAIDIFNGRIVQ